LEKDHHHQKGSVGRRGKRAPEGGGWENRGKARRVVYKARIRGKGDGGRKSNLGLGKKINETGGADIQNLQKKATKMRREKVWGENECPGTPNRKKKKKKKKPQPHAKQPKTSGKRRKTLTEVRDENRLVGGRGKEGNHSREGLDMGRKNSKDMRKVLLEAGHCRNAWERRGNSRKRKLLGGRRWEVKIRKKKGKARGKIINSKKRGGDFLKQKKTTEDRH